MRCSVPGSALRAARG